MLVYHRTEHSEAILREGFQAEEKCYGSTQRREGVWVSADNPVGLNEGAWGDVVLVLDIPEELFNENEWREEGKGYREAQIPPEKLNPYLDGVRVIHDPQDEVHPDLLRLIDSNSPPSDSRN
jgi:hypothetical protein